jgi:hypothetical protein
MPLYTSVEMGNALDHSPRKSLQRAEITAQQFGPGELGTWDCFMVGKENPWTSVGIRANSAKKPKIIFSHGLLNEYLLEKRDLSFISALIENYEVYLWPGDDVPFSTAAARPIQSSEEFWRLRDKVVSASAAQVKETLANQKMSSQEFQILDFARYQRAQRELNKREPMGGGASAEGDLSLSGIDVSSKAFQERLQALDEKDREKIDRIQLDSPSVSALQQIRKCFPNASEVVISGISPNQADAFEKDLEIFPEYVLTKYRSGNFFSFYLMPSVRKALPERKAGNKLLHLALKYINEEWVYEHSSLKSLGQVEVTGVEDEHGEYLGSSTYLYTQVHEKFGIHFHKAEAVLPPSPDLKTLSLKNSSRSDSLKHNFNSTPNLQGLTIENFSDLSDIDFTPLANSLHSLSLSSKLDLSPLFYHPEGDPDLIPQVLSPTISLLTQLRRLSLKHWDLVTKSSLDIANLPLLEDLVLDSCKIQELKIPQSNKIKRLKISCCKDLAALDLSQFPNLEELEFDGETKLSHLDLSVCRNLKRIHINSNISVNLSGLTQLEYLFLAGNNNMPDLSSCHNLRTLVLHDVISPRIDLSKHPELESAVIYSQCSYLNTNGLTRLKFIKINNISMHAAVSKKDIEKHVDGRETCHLDFSTNSALNSVSVTTPANLQVNFSHCEKLHFIKQLSANGTITATGLDSCSQLRSIHVEAENKEEVLARVCAPACQVGVPIKEEMSPSRPVSLHPAGFALKHSVRPGVSSASHASDEMLAQQNNASPVSLCAYQDEQKLDSNTALPATPMQHKNAFSLTLEEKGRVERNHYRQQICESLTYDPHHQKISLSFVAHKVDCKPVSMKISSLDDIKLNNARRSVASDATQGIGYFTGQFVPGKLYSLATLDAMAFDSLMEVSCDPPDAIQLHYHARHKQFYLEVPPGNPLREIKLMYRYKRDMLQRLRAVGDPVIESKRDLLPPEIRSALEQEIKTNPNLAFMQDAKKSLREKMIALEEYCGGFTNAALHAKPSNEIEALIATIREQKGSCRHRANAFMALAHFLSIAAYVVINEQHAFCEVPYPSGQHRVDLGGAPAVDLTPLDRRNNVFAKSVVAPTPTPVPVLSVAKKMDTPKQVAFRERYAKEFEKISGITPLASLNELLKPSSFHTVLEIENEKDLENVRDQLIAKFRSEHQSTAYLDIRSPDDLRYYFECYDIKEKQRVEVRGPLKTILEQGGVLLIDWSRFTPAQIANFKSLIDRSDANLFGQKVSANVHAIGFTRKNTQTCNAFLSRCQKYAMTPALRADLMANKRVERKSSRDPIVVDLRYKPNWHDVLLGRVAASKSGLDFIEGFLFEAMRTNRPLYIYSAPNDEALRVLVDKANRERRSYRGGTAYEAGDEFEIKLFSTPSPRPVGFIPVNNIFFTHKKVEAARIPSGRIYVGSHNWHELFSRLAIEDKQPLPPLPGFLEEQEKSVFYITNSLSKSEWSMLVEYTESFPLKKFYFELAPQVEIEGVESNPSVSKRVPIDSFKHSLPTLIASNDPSLTCEDILQEKGEVKSAVADEDKLKVSEEKESNVMVVTLTPEMGYHNLIASITQEDSKTKQIEFHYTEAFVLTALKAGKTVVLKGDLSPALYQRLLPLLSDSPHIESNGQRVTVPGKLICVVPDHTLRRFPFHPVHEYHFSETEYRKRCGADAKLADTVQTYFNWLNRLPHIESQVLTFARLKNIIARLKNTRLEKVHSHNPIKEFLLEYFPKGEPTESARREDYSYMNVLGKYLFRPTDDAPRRQKKLVELHASANLTDPHAIRAHVWRILNCLNGAELHRLFGDDLSAIIDSSHGMPTLTRPAFEILHTFLREHLADEVKEEKKAQTRIEKTKRHIQAFLQVGESKILVFTGMPGRGKTHAVDELKKEGGTVYRGRNKQDLIDWLEHKDDGRPCYLELSEYNMISEGSWDFLEGIAKNPPIITYQGKKYALSPNHWIIATGNPVGFEGRQVHSLFQQQSKAVPFTMSEDHFLEENILRPRLAGVAQAQSGLLLKVFNLIKRHNPTGYYSYRDLQNLAARVNLLVKNAVLADIPDRVYEACEVEFASAMAKPQRREAFLTELKQLWIPAIREQKSEQVIEVKPNKFVPKEAEYAIKSLQQAARMREEKCLTGKQIILLEGDPGVGKSALIDALLIPDCKINAGDGEGAKAALRKAFSRREVISLEEFNLDEDHSVEELLIQLLEKEQQDIEAGDRPGQRTLIIASQNSAAEQGRSSISLAMQNRTQHVYINAYSRASLEAIATRRGVEEPEVFVDVYLKTPGANMRMFYRELDLLDEQRIEAADQKTLDEKFSQQVIDDFKTAIAVLKNHGEFLCKNKKESGHGAVAYKLGSELETLSNRFFKEFPKISDAKAQIEHYQQFEKVFTEKLHSKDKKLSVHRDWTPLLSNIAVALTGIGTLVMVGRLIYTARQGNMRGLFRTQREVNRDKIAANLANMKKKLKK